VYSHMLKNKQFLPLLFGIGNPEPFGRGFPNLK
jgi:hypothetical protein